MRLSSAGFVLRRVRHSLWQLLWTHVLTSGTMAMTLFVFGAFILVQINLENLLKGWGDQLQITAYLKKDARADAVQELIARVQSFPEVEGVSHTNQEQAWRDFQAALGSQSGLLDGLPKDLLPASLEVRIKSEQRDSPAVERLAQRLTKEAEIAGVEYPQEWVERLALIVLGVRWAKWIVGGVLFLAAFFIVGSTAKLAVLARRDEVTVMQWVGASERLVQAPFLIEGMALGLIGAAFAVGALWCVYFILRQELPTLGGFFISSGNLLFLDPTSVTLIVAIGWSLGAAGSLASLRSFVRKWKPLRREA
ncbi:MAG TPA: ABC transporter permease [Terriglobales bacterium]|nr:ABC transporter permease [Terriglobales bacterium]